MPLVVGGGEHCRLTEFHRHRTATAPHPCLYWVVCSGSSRSFPRAPISRRARRPGPSRRFSFRWTRFHLWWLSESCSRGGIGEPCPRMPLIASSARWGTSGRTFGSLFWIWERRLSIWAACSWSKGCPARSVAAGSRRWGPAWSSPFYELGSGDSSFGLATKRTSSLLNCGRMLAGWARASSGIQTLSICRSSCLIFLPWSSEVAPKPSAVWQNRWRTSSKWFWRMEYALGGRIWRASFCPIFWASWPLTSNRPWRGKSIAAVTGCGTVVLCECLAVLRGPRHFQDHSGRCSILVAVLGQQ